MSKNKNKNNERGIALIMAMLSLLLVTAVALGMIYMSSTEAAIDNNYRDTQVAFFAMRAGLEEARDRIRSNALNALTLPTAMPGSSNSIYYITNPNSSTDTVDPKTFGNAYFDDEFCHEQFASDGITYVAPTTGYCNSSAEAPPSSSVAAYVASVSPNTGTSAALPFKWVRITLKQNATFPTAVVDSTQGNSVQVCWNAVTQQEVAITSLGYTSCTAAASAGLYVEPLYIVTSMAVTPTGSRRIGQYELGAYNIAPPAGGLVLDGPTPSFNTPHSNNAGINGNDGSGTPPSLSGCSTTSASEPAIATDSTADATLVGGEIFRPGNFTGAGGSTPSVVSDASVLGSGTTWDTPGDLNQLITSLGDSATKQCNSGIGGSSCNATTLGTTAAPQTTYINGDFSPSASSGAGTLIVTGTLTINGAFTYDGLILVVGQGAIVINGGGNGQFYGEMLVARTNSSTSPYSQLSTMGSPSFTWNGGGKSSMYYNSCWADYGNSLLYTVVSSREEMY
jgi:Tfp pilus assembly protein PilX